MSAVHDRLCELEAQLAPARQRLLAHPIYAAIDREPRLRVFMTHHVFAVWDFMSLLKALQRELTCVAVPWRPVGDAAARRLINEIVLAEESDDVGAGQIASHFELYLGAMADIGADAAPIAALTGALAIGTPIGDALAAPAIPPAARAFVRDTFACIGRGRPHEVAAAFTYGREDVIPDMFRRLVTTLGAAEPARYRGLRAYLDRHIAIDGDAHGPAARRLVAMLCGDDPAAWTAATIAAERAIGQRIALWDGIAAAVT